jgi:hypothetical protein
MRYFSKSEKISFVGHEVEDVYKAFKVVASNFEDDIEAPRFETEEELDAFNESCASFVEVIEEEVLE